MGAAFIPSAVLILRHFIKVLDEHLQSPTKAVCSRSKLIALCRSVIMHQMRLVPNDAAERAEVFSAMLRDLSVGSRRIEQDGISAVCDDPSHVEWLSDTAWNLASETLVHDDPSRSPDLMLTVGFLSMAYSFSSALPASEGRLQQQMRSQGLICKCHLTLAGRVDSNEQMTAAAQQHLQQASIAIQLCFRIQQRLGQTCGQSKSPRDGSHLSEAEELGPLLQLLNFEVSLRRGDPNLRQASKAVHHRSSFESMSPDLCVCRCSCESLKLRARALSTCACSLSKAFG